MFWKRCCLFGIVWGLYGCLLTNAADEVFRTVIRQPGDDGSKAYRIPGLATSTKGTLLAVYDIRYAGFGDLPGDIDVGLRRSFDNGRTWEAQQVIIDYDKSVPEARGNGVGDPAIVVDQKTGAIFVIALWSQGNRAWHGSGPGLAPHETGQLVLVKSTDDGKTWSAPVNLTSKIAGRDPKWRLLFNGPGAGIQTSSGALIFAAQFRDADGVPHACFLSSPDAGESWAVSAPAIAHKPPTSEAQIAELSDASLLLTMRDESHSGQRAWARFQPDKVLPAGTWDPWRSALPDSTCMASLIRHPSGALLFSNPASAKARVGMTLRVSDDDGKTWSTGRVLDARPAAYSCLTILADGSIGILYETGDKNSAETLVYANVSLAWIRQGADSPRQEKMK
jgi:sialidase-1